MNIEYNDCYIIYNDFITTKTTKTTKQHCCRERADEKQNFLCQQNHFAKQSSQQILKLDTKTIE